ncbi:lipase member K-like [Belonocnema kinseyi]|uniref:lipase member K-like n=1 Tax=Belonocnema kinseyi TaxID=2817044 RepID=UPI00143D9476|nr:lipase member K-like [Belonocnema kinseyi]
MEKTFFIFAITLCHGVVFTDSGRPDPSVTINKLIMNYGYAFEIHNVITDDGYILEIHRIPGIINGKLNGTKKEKVALLMHGLIGSSATWVLTGPNRSIAFNLVNKGYDVWLGNNRGNTYSTKHVSKLETSYGFWDFSWHEMGIYDLPATIDYVLRYTNKKSLHLLCFSQGCTQTFVMGSLKPEYNKKIKFVVALSPAVYMTHLSGIASFISPFTYILSSILGELGFFPFLQASPLFRIFTSYFCKLGSLFQPICLSIIFAFIGPGYEEIDQDKLEHFLKYEPAGSSLKQAAHYGFGQYNPDPVKVPLGNSSGLSDWSLMEFPRLTLGSIRRPRLFSCLYQPAFLIVDDIFHEEMKSVFMNFELTMRTNVGNKPNKIYLWEIESKYVSRRMPGITRPEKCRLWRKPGGCIIGRRSTGTGRRSGPGTKRTLGRGVLVELSDHKRRVVPGTGSPLDRSFWCLFIERRRQNAYRMQMSSVTGLPRTYADQPFQNVGAINKPRKRDTVSQVPCAQNGSNILLIKQFGLFGVMLTCACGFVSYAKIDMPRLLSFTVAHRGLSHGS